MKQNNRISQVGSRFPRGGDGAIQVEDAEIAALKPLEWVERVRFKLRCGNRKDG